MSTRTILTKVALAAAFAGVLTGCSEKKWHAEGRIDGADGKDLVLEAPTYHGGWYAVDTVSIGSNGSFKLSGKPAGHPEVYRLTIDGNSYYFPVDSLETVTVNADKNGYTVSGSASADRMQEINAMIDKVVSTSGEKAVAYDAGLKRALAEAVLRDPSGIVAYYTIFRRVGDTRLFDPADKADLRLIGAVANAFAQNRPSDPRTPFLAQLYTSGRKAVFGTTSQPTDTLVATEITLPEISLLDENGKRRSITDEASKGKVIVLNFTAYGAQESPAFNVALAKVYDDYKARGLEIFQVSVDEDEFFWREAARNLPWITVYNSPKEGAATLMRYNVQGLPATYIINRDGELVERVDDISRLSSSVGRYL
ncbi:MAG: AhpC/TSA family protein [Muribaculaceae bacterium]|nr:AhpC/TSA family protein [Muribaculaceae bacterium]